MGLSKVVSMVVKKAEMWVAMRAEMMAESMVVKMVWKLAEMMVVKMADLKADK